ncbi:hypothetical protein AAFF_G00030310 [Aldrovandia affinis]|uniref:Uncharacterized protein n=1 Tax=Aldrovandia affinis TaxID=143900 RepID=A0AAD7WGB2_9TELE|nr:hypothetical protein AAFF_G00030310 [Aldrovandia affinis]
MGGERRRVDYTPAACHPSRVGSDGGPVATTAPSIGRVDWEERKHWLLLQKIELEVQRERLQAQLALQEERLILQNRQLRQSRIDYSRFRGAASALDPPEDSDAALSGVAQRNQATRGGAGPVRVSAPSAPGEVEGPGRTAAQQEGEEETAALPLHRPLQPKEAPAVSRRDAATSPAAAQTQLQPDPRLIPTLPKTPCARLQSSVVELLDMFSPLAVPIQRRAACQAHTSGKPRPARPAPLSSLLSPWAPPHRSPTSPEEDAEESQILEDIFFIC